jgi:chaperonin GroEL
LLRAIPALENLKVENPDQKTGIDIVRKAIQAPARQIVDNAGADGAVVVGKLLEAKEYSYGYDAQTMASSIRPRSYAPPSRMPHPLQV